MDNIVDINEFKSEREKNIDDDSRKELELELICDYVIAEWTVNFTAGTIDEMICRKLNESYFEYSKDLNSISQLELSLGASFIIFGPGTTDTTSTGFIAGMKYQEGKPIIATPEMTTENYCRLFAILFYNELLIQNFL